MSTLLLTNEHMYTNACYTTQQIEKVEAGICGKRCDAVSNRRVIYFPTMGSFGLPYRLSQEGAIASPPHFEPTVL